MEYKGLVNVTAINWPNNDFYWNEGKDYRVSITDDLNGKPMHVDDMTSQGSQRLRFLALLEKAGVDPNSPTRVYASLVRSVPEYAKYGTRVDKKSDEGRLVTGSLIRLNKLRTCNAWPWHPHAEARISAHGFRHCAEGSWLVTSATQQLLMHLKLSGLKSLESRRQDMCKAFFYAMQGLTHKLHYELPSSRIPWDSPWGLHCAITCPGTRLNVLGTLCYHSDSGIGLASATIWAAVALVVHSHRSYLVINIHNIALVSLRYFSCKNSIIGCKGSNSNDHLPPEYSRAAILPLPV